MAERIVIQIDTDDQELDNTIDKLEKLGVIDKKNKIILKKRGQ
jgi:hypothetical protein